MPEHLEDRELRPPANRRQEHDFACRIVRGSAGRSGIGNPLSEGESQRSDAVGILGGEARGGKAAAAHGADLVAHDSRRGDVLEQRRAGDTSIVGLMLESNLHAGAQKVSPDREKLAYGVSITDACIGWDETEARLLEAHERLGG